MIGLFSKWFILMVLCMILQTSFIPMIALWSVQPDIILIAFFFLCLKYGTLPGIYVGFFLGLGMDLYTPSMTGQNALAKTLVGYFWGIFNEKVMRTDLVFKVMIIIVGFIIHDILFIGSEFLKNGDSLVPIFSELVKRTLPRTAYTMIIALFIHFWNNYIKPNLKR